MLTPAPSLLPCLYTAGELGRRVGPHHPFSKVRSVERARRQAKIRVQRDHRHFQVCCILHALLHRISLRADVVALSLGSSALQQHFGDLFSPVPRSAVGRPSPPRRGGPDRTYSIPACSEANAVDLVIRCVDPASMYTICVGSDTVMGSAISASQRRSPTFSSRHSSARPSPMTALPPLSRSLPDLTTVLDELDGLEDLPDRPPSPPYSPPRVHAVRLDESAETWPLGEQETNGVDKKSQCFPGPELPQDYEPQEDNDPRRDGSAGSDREADGRERSPSIGSIHSAPELAGPPSPRSTSSERPDFDAVDTFASSPPTSPTFLDAALRKAPGPSTLWDYLREEVSDAFANAKRIPAKKQTRSCSPNPDLLDRSRRRGGYEERESDQLPDSTARAGKGGRYC